MQKFTVQVETDAEYEVVLTDHFFRGMTEQERLKEFSEDFYEVNTLNDVVEYIILFYKQWPEGFLEGVGKVSNYAKDAAALIKTNYVYNKFTGEE